MDGEDIFSQSIASDEPPRHDDIAWRARVLIEGHILMERTFTGEAGQTLAADVDFQRWAHEALDAQEADERERETPP